MLRLSWLIHPRETRKLSGLLDGGNPIRLYGASESAMSALLALVLVMIEGVPKSWQAQQTSSGGKRGETCTVQRLQFFLGLFLQLYFAVPSEKHCTPEFLTFFFETSGRWVDRVFFFRCTFRTLVRGPPAGPARDVMRRPPRLVSAPIITVSLVSKVCWPPPCCEALPPANAIGPDRLNDPL